MNKMEEKKEKEITVEEEIDNKKTEEKEESKEKKTEKKSFLEKIKNIPYKFAIILGILLIVVIIIPKRLPSIFKNSNYSKIEKICNLATVEVYYHNVAEKIDEASTIGKIFGNIGYKKYWLEYDAVIEYGIDAKKVKIEKPNFKNEVKVHLPEAEVLGEPRLIKEYIKDPVTDSGFLTSVSNDDKIEAVENSIKTLKTKASDDKEHRDLAYERAKKFFENYIVSAGKEIGTNYSVIFD